MYCAGERFLFSHHGVVPISFASITSPTRMTIIINLLKRKLFLSLLQFRDSCLDYHSILVMQRWVLPLVSLNIIVVHDTHRLPSPGLCCPRLFLTSNI